MGRIIVVFLAGVASVGVGLWMGMMEENASKNEPVSNGGGQMYADAPPPAYYLTPQSTAIRQQPVEEPIGSVPAPAEQGGDVAAEMDVVAVESFARSLNQVDARMPPLSPGLDRELPTEEQLEDHDQYLLYEAEQTRKLYKAYVVAAEEKVNRLKEEVQYAAVQGLPEEQLMEGEEKIKRINAMQQELEATLQQ